MIVLISIGNSDDKLGQGEWSKFIASMREVLAEQPVQIHGEWFSAPDVQWQNCNWLVEVEVREMGALEGEVRSCRKKFRQASAAWTASAYTRFI